MNITIDEEVKPILSFFFSGMHAAYDHMLQVHPPTSGSGDDVVKAEIDEESPSVKCIGKLIKNVTYQR